MRTRHFPAVGVVLLSSVGALAQCQPEWVQAFPGDPLLAAGAFALTVFDDGSGPALYAGGGLGTPSSGLFRVGKWSGQSWVPMSTGINNYVWSLAGFDDGSGPALYAGGEFWQAGGASANFIARWNAASQSWAPLGEGTSDKVYALQVFDDGSGPALFAGGDFGYAGGLWTPHIARWSSAGWAAVGDGMNNEVLGFKAVPGALYVGGSFTVASGVPANAIARYGGGSFSALGSGVSGWGKGVEEWNGRVYVGGHFTGAGGSVARSIASWDPGTGGWSNLGGGVTGLTGVQGTVWDVEVFDDGGGGGEALYVVGEFVSAGGVPADRIARWTGTSWQGVGAGFNSTIHTMTVFDPGDGLSLYVGGLFSSSPAGDRVIARYRGCRSSPPPPCYGNCDSSTTAPVLNVADFTCFLQRFAAGEPYANCDGSTQAPVLNVQDFTCFLQRYAAGCP